MTTITAWHFVADTLRDGRPIPEDWETLRFDGEPILCRQGLHASIDPFDALQYAQGATLCLVRCGGEIVHGHDKLVCTERTIIARCDATPGLRYFARLQALSVVHLWEPPAVVLDYLMTGDESIKDAAWAAERDATRGTARDAAWGAARDAAWGAVARAEFNTLVREAFGDFL